ncbi:eukaryotic translation initiation factor 3 subunit C [Sigmodon hispidus]
MKIRDITKCLEEFELQGKAYGKAKSIVDKEGVPRFYILVLADLENYLNELWEDKEGKKMNKNNAKALSTLRLKIRKYNRNFESHITKYKQRTLSSLQLKMQRRMRKTQKALQMKMESVLQLS